MDIVANIIGLGGAGVVLVAYFLLSAGKISSEQPCYPLMNMIGSIGVLVSLAWHWNMPSAVINSIWVVISLVALVRIYGKRRTARRGPSSEGRGR